MNTDQANLIAGVVEIAIEIQRVMEEGGRYVQEPMEHALRHAAEATGREPSAEMAYCMGARDALGSLRERWASLYGAKMTDHFAEKGIHGKMGEAERAAFGMMTAFLMASQKAVDAVNGAAESAASFEFTPKD